MCAPADHKKVVMKDAESYFPEPSERVGGKISNAWAWHQVRAQPRSPSTRVGTHLSLRDRMHPVLEHATAAAFTRGAGTGLWLLVQRPDRLTPELISCSVAIEYEHSHHSNSRAC